MSENFPILHLPTLLYTPKCVNANWSAYVGMSHHKNQRPEEKAPPKQKIEENIIATYYNYEFKEFLQKPVEWFDGESFEN